jgi:hypothetical protein
MRMVKVRCSSLDRVLKCTHSLKLPVERYGVEASKEIIDMIRNDSLHIDDNQHASQGTAQHILAELYINGKVEIDRLNPNTQVYARYVSNGYTLENSMCLDFDGFTLLGTPDAYKIISDDTIEIVDLKNGFQEVSIFSNQFKGYGVLLLNKYPKVSKVKITIVQNCRKTSQTFKRREIEGLVDVVQKKLKENVWEEGPHCQFCPSVIHCLKKSEKLTKINAKSMLENLKNESDIVKYLKESKKYLLKHRPEWFNIKTRRIKKWIDKSQAPREEGILSPAQALAKGYDVDDNITIKISESYEIK